MLSLPEKVKVGIASCIRRLCFVYSSVLLGTGECKQTCDLLQIRISMNFEIKLCSRVCKSKSLNVGIYLQI